MAYIEVFITGSTVSEFEQLADELPEATDDHTPQLGWPSGNPHESELQKKKPQVSWCWYTQPTVGT